MPGILNVRSTMTKRSNSGSNMWAGYATSKEEWKKIGRWETWRPAVKDTGKGIGKMFIVKVFTVIILITLVNMGIF